MLHVQTEEAPSIFDCGRQLANSFSPGAADRIEMAPEPDGYFSARAESAYAGTRCRFLLNGEEKGFPDPASRFQPEGPHGASEGTAMLRQLDGMVSHLRGACVGSISEIFDAEEPYLPRGCISQAWSIAEVLRSWQKCRQLVKPYKNRRSQNSRRPDQPSGVRR